MTWLICHLEVIKKDYGMELSQPDFIKKHHFFEKLKKIECVKKIILFGSRARGDHAQRSDIDLVISCPQATSKDWLTILDIIEDADTLLKIDCIKLESLSETNHLRKSIQKEGVVLYERQ